MTDTARVKPDYQAGHVSIDTDEWVALQTALREARERAEAAEAGAAALREGLEWALREGGWRLWYYASKLPAVVVTGRPGEDATVAGDAGAATLAELQRLREFVQAVRALDARKPDWSQFYFDVGLALEALVKAEDE